MKRQTAPRRSSFRTLPITTYHIPHLISSTQFTHISSNLSNMTGISLNIITFIQSNPLSATGNLHIKWTDIKKLHSPDLEWGRLESLMTLSSKTNLHQFVIDATLDTQFHTCFYNVHFTILLDNHFYVTQPLIGCL